MDVYETERLLSLAARTLRAGAGNSGVETQEEWNVQGLAQPESGRTTTSAAISCRAI